MKRLLAGLLLIGLVGCGGNSPPQSASTAPSPSSVAKPATTVATPPTNVTELPAQADDADAVVTLEELGVKIVRNAQGQVVVGNFYDTQITDAGLVHLKGLTNLRNLYLNGAKINLDARL